MPILDIEIIASSPDPSLPADLAQSLADEVAKVFGGPEGTVWVKLHILPSGQYAEDRVKAEDVVPVFVTVLKSQVPSGSELEGEIGRLTRAIAKVLSRPMENIHIIYHADGAGRVAFGGRLVR